MQRINIIDPLTYDIDGKRYSALLTKSIYEYYYDEQINLQFPPFKVDHQINIKSANDFYGLFQEGKKRKSGELVQAAIEQVKKESQQQQKLVWNDHWAKKVFKDKSWGLDLSSAQGYLDLLDWQKVMNEPYYIGHEMILDGGTSQTIFRHGFNVTATPTATSKTTVNGLAFSSDIFEDSVDEIRIKIEKYTGEKFKHHKEDMFNRERYVMTYGRDFVFTLIPDGDGWMAHFLNISV